MKTDIVPAPGRRTALRWSSYIFVHDQAIVLAYERFRKFSRLPGVTYVFLGEGPVGRISGKPNVIVARHLPRNLESFPRFTAFTGWYALWKNNLIDADYVNLFEYDINLDTRFFEALEGLAEGTPDFIGHLPRPMDDYQYIRNARWVESIIPAIRLRYGVDVEELVAGSLRSSEAPRWSSTSNATFSRSCFHEYMGWFEGLIDDVKESETSGHAHERSISFFCQIFDKKVVFTDRLMTHLQLNSHRTQGHSFNWKWAVWKLTAGDRISSLWPSVRPRLARPGLAP